MLPDHGGGLRCRSRDRAAIAIGQAAYPSKVARKAASMGVCGSAPGNATSVALSSRSGRCRRQASSSIYRNTVTNGLRA